MNFKKWIGRMFGLTDSGPWASFYGTETYSGKAVTADMALQLAAVWACVRVTSQAIASLPLQMYEKDGSGGRRQIDHPLAEIIGQSPNADMTSLEFWESVTAWLCTYGNAYAEIARQGDRIIALNLIPADQMQVLRTAAGELEYRFNERGKPYVLPAESVLHIKGFGYGGDLGLNPIRYGAQIFGNATAAEEAAGKTLGAGMMPSGLLETDQELTDAQRDMLDGVMKQYSGSSRAGKTMIMEAGLKYNQISLDPETMQLLETRRLSTETICMFMGTPPVVIGHAAPGVTQWGTGVEAIKLQWLSMGLNPLATRIERRIAKQLIGPGERGRVYAEFNREALLQMDSTTKAAFMSSMVQNGLMSRSEAREKLNLPYRPEANGLTAQTNLAPLDKLGGSPDAAAKSAVRSWLGIEEIQNVD